MKILITGAAGFIGHCLTEALLKDASVFIMAIDSINDYYSVDLKLERLNNIGITGDFSSEIKSLKNENLKFKKINIEDIVELEQLFEKENFDCVIHLAAQAGVRYSLENPNAYIQSNLVGFMNILECLRKYSIRKFIFASSSSVYGANKILPFSESHCTDSPVSFYAATKKANEVIAHSYSHLYNIETIGLRFFTVYGPWGRPDMAPMIFANKIIKGEVISVFNHGNMMRDFTYVNDVSKIIKKILYSPLSINKTNTITSNAKYRLYNIGNHKPIKLMEFLNEMETAFSKKAVFKYEDIKPGDVENTFADINSLETDYNIIPETDLATGLKEFANWYKWYFNLKS